jgi:hypothetical protein
LLYVGLILVRFRKPLSFSFKIEMDPTYEINGIKFVGNYAYKYFVTAVLLGWSMVDAAILNSFGICVIPVLFQMMKN